MARDAEATRKRLLDAAIAEFSARGIAGARVDRIADAAGCNKAMIYAYFGSKDGLFDAAVDALFVDTLRDIPIDPDDLPGYTVELFDHYRAQPEGIRLLTWYRLERGELAEVPEAVANAHRDKIIAIKRAQNDGRLPKDFPAEELLALVVNISMIGVTHLGPQSDDPAAIKRHRRTVARAVRRLVR
ncbi:MAG: TetR family transcriptional regulator [Actinomycetota bacterium]